MERLALLSVSAFRCRLQRPASEDGGVGVHGPTLDLL